MFSYDAENRLISVTSGGNTVQFVYDSDGKRIKKIENGQTTVYVGKHYEKNTATSVETKYYQALGQPVAMWQTGFGTTSLYRNHLGSTSAASNGSTRSYWPFGSERSSSGTTPTDRRYTGQQWNSSVGLYYYGARFYDPANGRFISADTIVPQPGNPQSLNRYAYALNNPLRYTDPSGHDPMDGLWFIAGVGGQWAHDNLSVWPQAREVLAVKADESFAMTAGRHVGNVVAMFQSGAEVTIGGGSAVGGGGLCLTGVGCLAGAPAVAVGMAVAGHGVAVGGVALSQEGQMLSGFFAAATQKHHIATNKNWRAGSQWSAKFDQLFKQAGMDLNDDINIVELPHAPGRHRSAYHQWIYDQLTSATARLQDEAEIKAALQSELRVIADMLREHPEWITNPPITSQ